MPALPWVQRETMDPEAAYVTMASYLPLKRHRSIPGFLRDTLAIRRQLAQAEGLIAYGLDAELLKGVFWTFSVWKTQEHLDAFARSDPHRQIIERLRPRMDQTRFEFITVAAGKLPTTWEQRKALLR
jgi:hypothetical protein